MIDFHEYPVYSKPQFPESGFISAEFYWMDFKGGMHQMKNGEIMIKVIYLIWY